MTEDIEERFRRACSAYLADVEHAERQRERAAEAALEAESARLAADRSRDQLVRLVRERDLAGVLRSYGPAGGPVGDGLDDQRRAHYSSLAPGGGVVTKVMAPEDTDWWARHGGMCPECGVSWRELSPDCPHKVVNWHPKH